MIILLSLFFVYNFSEGTFSNEWKTEKQYLCDDSVSFLVQVNQIENPFEDDEISIINYQSHVSAVFQFNKSNPEMSDVRSALIYQCAFCAPYKLKDGTDTLQFELSKFFDDEEKVNGRLYLEFNWNEVSKTELYETLDCYRSRVLQFEVKKSR